MACREGRGNPPFSFPPPPFSGACATIPNHGTLGVFFNKSWAASPRLPEGVHGCRDPTSRANAFSISALGV